MPQPLLTFLVYIPGTSCNYRSLNFIGVLQRANVSMPLHFHMQTATSIHPPAHPRALKALLCVARLLEKSRRAPCEPQARMRGGGRGKKGREGEADDEVAAVPWTHCAHYWPGSLVALWVINCSAAAPQTEQQSMGNYLARSIFQALRSCISSPVTTLDAEHWRSLTIAI